MLKERNISIRKASIGDINKKDVNEAKCDKEIKNCLILGFNVKKNPEVKDEIKIITNDVIYKLIEDLEKYKEEKPDLVIMDITMPVMDGITSVKEIKGVDGDAKIAMLSAMGQQQMVIEAIKAGAKDFVLKPFQPDKLMGVVNKLLGVK